MLSPNNPKLKETRLCECGCGTEINAFMRDTGKPKRFARGHHCRVPTAARLAHYAKLGERNRVINWNRGKRYIIEKRTVYANRSAWQNAVKRCYADACMVCGWDEAPCDAHHIQPKAQGGEHSIANAVVLCPNCHRRTHYGRLPTDELLTAKAAAPIIGEAH